MSQLHVLICTPVRWRDASHVESGRNECGVCGCLVWVGADARERVRAVGAIGYVPWCVLCAQRRLELSPFDAYMIACLIERFEPSAGQRQ